MRDLAYLKLLAREYPTVKSATSEIINLMAIRGLPKGTEYFFSDLHGEYEAFIHFLKSSSGDIRYFTVPSTNTATREAYSYTSFMSWEIMTIVFP